MALRKAKALTFRPTGLSDSQDGTNTFAGAMQILTNLVPNPATDKTFVPRPAAQPLIFFGAPQELWVAGSSCEILEFPLTATGNVAPTIDIQGALTQLTSLLVNGDDKSFTMAVEVDSAGKQYACGWKLIAGGTGIQYFYTVYVAGANGNVAPTNYVHGAATGFDAFVVQASNGGICVDASGNVYVGFFTKILMFPAGSDGNAASTTFATIAAGSSRQITSLFYDAVRRWIWVSASGNLSDNALYAYDLTGVLQVTITDGTNFSTPWQVAIGPDLSIYVSDTPNFGEVLVYAPNASGASLPVRTISLPSVAASKGIGVAVDSNGRVYAAAEAGTTSSLFVYEAGASDVLSSSPIQTIAGTNTRFDTMLPGSSPPNAVTNIQQLRIR